MISITPYSLQKRIIFFAAWSNESFELWYYLHFQYLDTGISRSQYIEKIERETKIEQMIQTTDIKRNHRKLSTYYNV